MKKVLFTIKLAAVSFASYLIVVIDRVIMAPFVFIELPTAKEIQAFDHYKDQIGKRCGAYLFIILLYAVFWNIWHFQEMAQIIKHAF